MLKSVTSGQSLGAVGASDDLSQIGKDDNAEAGRDYTSRIDDLIKRIQVAQNSQHSTKEGDVTEHAILEVSGELRSRSQPDQIRDVSRRELVAGASARHDSRSRRE